MGVIHQLELSNPHGNLAAWEKGFYSCLEGVFRDAAPLLLYLEIQAKKSWIFPSKKKKNPRDLG